GLRQALEQADRDAAERSTCLAERERLATTLAAADFAAEAQAALALLGRQLAALAYDADAHAALRQEQAALEPCEARHRELERAREGLPREEEILRSLNAEAAQWGTRLADDEARAEA